MSRVLNRLALPAFVLFSATLLATGAFADFGPAQGVAPPDALTAEADTLATVLSRGSVTGGTDLTITAGDSLILSDTARITSDARVIDWGGATPLSGASVLDDTGLLVHFGRDGNDLPYINMQNTGSFVWTDADGVVTNTFYASDGFNYYDATDGHRFRSMSTVFAEVDANGLAVWSGPIYGEEISDPGSAPANGWRLYARDNGGKTELVVVFASGAVQVLATEP